MHRLPTRVLCISEYERLACLHMPGMSRRCQAPVVPVGIVFKGSGWYINDSRAPEKSEGSTPKEGEGKGDGASAAPAKTEASAAESKTAESTSTAKKETAAAGAASS